jgi:hypothetical protein
MRAHRVPAVIAGATAIALASLLVASPAAAATLPDGQRITVIENDFVPVGPPANTYFDVNPADAAVTQVGSPGGAIVTSMDVNDDGVGYGTGATFIQNQVGSIPTLYPTNAATGVTGPGVTIDPVDPDVTITECRGIDVQPDGTIFVACINAPDSLVNSYLGTVTPGGAFTVFFDSQEEEDTALFFTAIAIDPTTGQLWVFEFDSFWSVDRSASPWTLGNINSTEGNPVYGADFASNGQLFVTTTSGESNYLLGTLAFETDFVTIVHEFTEGGDVLDQVQAITVWGKKALPATGPADVLPIGLASALLLLAGAAFIATGRIRRRATTE